MSSPLSRKDLKRIFEKLDANHDGLVSLNELNCLLRGVVAFQLGPAELEAVVGKTALDFDDFLLFYHSISRDSRGGGGGGLEPSSSSSSKPEDDEGGGVGEDLAKAFGVFDLNGDGFITCDELRSVLVRLGLMGENSTGRDCSRMIGAFDANSDGQLDFEEFKNMMLLSS